MENVTPSILITGGGGFIGSHLAQIAAQMNFLVTCTVKQGSINYRHINDVEYLEVNFLDESQLRQSLGKRKFTYVVNLLGSISHKSFFDGGTEIFGTHYLGTQNLISILDRTKLKKFIQIGSSDEYGDAHFPQHENLRESPQTPYSLGKVAATQLIQMLHRTENFPGMVLRPFLIYGPGQSEQRLVPHVIIGCLENRGIELSSGEQIRDFLFINDAVEAIIECLRNEETSGEVLNLGSGIGVSVKDLAISIREIIGQGTLIFGSVNPSKRENKCLISSNEKITRLTSWTPSTNLQAGLIDTIESFRKNLI